MTRVWRGLLPALLALATACAGASPSTGAGAEQGDGLAGDLVVHAAASLTDAFEDLAEAFESQHPDVRVVLNLAGSSTLAAQIVEGAPADVFAPASAEPLEVVADAGLVDEEVALVGNALEIVVERGNPLGIDDLDDLARDDVVLVLAAPEVPAGALAARLLADEGVAAAPASLEVDVRAALARVQGGEADAAIVYRSDVATASETVEPVAIPDARNLEVTYPIATLTGAPNPAVADAWVEFVTGPTGRDLLVAAGFTAP